MAEYNSIYATVPLQTGSSLHIRLLRLLPDHSASIACALRVAQLDDLPAYTAVSYLWGDPRRTDTILVNGRSFIVRQNIWNLLERLKRERYRGMLWIDAICIDQSSDSERSSQVALMGDIYSKATGVLSWLGIGSPDITRVMLQLPRMASQNRWTSEDWNEGFTKGIEALLSKSYWSRVWIFQEFVLARELSLRCGDHYVSAQVLTWVYEACLNGHVSGNISDRLFASPGMRVIKSRTLHHDGTPNGWSLSHLTQISSNLQCADMRDHVYAMLSLLSKKEASRLAIVPDYSKSVASLWTDLVLKELQDHGSPKILFHPKQMQIMFGLADDDPAVKSVKRLLEAEWIRSMQYWRS